MCFSCHRGGYMPLEPEILLVEIQQTSDLTYRIYDFDRRDSQNHKRPLHTEEAIEVIDFKKYSSYREDYKVVKNKVVNVVDCPYFTTNVMKFDKAVEKDFHLIDSFVIYICTEGKSDIRFGSADHGGYCKRGHSTGSCNAQKFCTVPRKVNVI